MIVRHITLSDKDYPIVAMSLVEDREKYDLFKIDDLTVVPLCQVIDLMETVKPSYIKKDNKCYCPICNSEVKEGFKVPKGKLSELKGENK